MIPKKVKGNIGLIIKGYFNAPQDDNEIIRVSVRFSDEDLWLTQNQLSLIHI